MRNSGRSLVVLLTVLVLLGLGMLFWQKKGDLNFSSKVSDSLKSAPPRVVERTAGPPPAKRPIGKEALSLEESFIQIAEEVKPAVVNISTVQVIKGRRMFRGSENDFFKGSPFEDFFKDFFEFPRQPERGWKQKSLGSGIIIDKDGYILTNNHVVARAEEIKVVLVKNEEYDAKIIGRDPKTDLAVIKIESNKALPVAALGDSDNLRVGQWAIAIGNPFGLNRTVTVGVISATGRAELGIATYENYIQTDASINRGNSGGPLLNIHGEVIGVNTAIVGGATGIGFAIPVNMAKEILGDLIDKGKVVRGWLGVIIQSITPDLKESFGLETEEGALVSDVLKDSPAEKAGIKRGDVIVTFGGQKVEDVRELQRTAAKAKVNEIIRLEIIRNKKPLSLEVKIGEMPRELPLEEEGKSVDEAELWLGIKVQEITPDLALQFNLSDRQGVIVTHVEFDSPAELAGIKARDIILEINGRGIKNPTDYDEAIKSFKKDAKVTVLIKRGVYTTFLVIKPESKK
ncbi:MAG: DegQ family serine endoprotease [Candidatus Ratteibacteria bacterium]|nr:DegQ family serine endoprotease [Candidatus Ratteibacteria bacterium]